LIPTPTPAPAPLAATCPASATLPPEAGLAQRRGVGSSAELNALFFQDVNGIRVDTEAKIVWRMTGSGTLGIEATGPGGQRIRPIWGPEVHDGSSWEQPGDEWGTGWKFPTAGCWKFTARRAVGSGYLVVRVR
jgi:hypothetical protein